MHDMSNIMAFVLGAVVMAGIVALVVVISCCKVSRQWSHFEEWSDMKVGRWDEVPLDERIEKTKRK